MTFTTLFLLILSFAILLYGAGIIVKSVDKFAHKLHLSSFSVSFFVLGILTSIPEFAVGLTSLSENTPEIFVGNLIGGSIVIFFLVIPLLAIFGGGVRLTHQLSRRNLLISFATVISPLIFLLDQRLSSVEGFVLIIIYGILFFLIQRDKGILDNGNSEILNVHSYSMYDILKIVLGLGMVFVASHTIVNQTILIAAQVGVSAFYVSLVILSLGTNLPELSLAVRSIISHKKDVAFGDYLGSAAANTLFFGIFTLLHSTEVSGSGNMTKTFLLVLVGLGIFYYFTRSQRNISKGEGILLLIYYVVFVVAEKL